MWVEPWRRLSTKELCFELWCWRRLSRVPWTAKKSNQSILKEINLECLLEGLMLKLKLQCFGHLIQRGDSLENILMLGKIDGMRRRGWQEMRCLDGITDSINMSLINSRTWWRAEKPGMLQFTGLQSQTLLEQQKNHRRSGEDVIDPQLSRIEFIIRNPAPLLQKNALGTVRPSNINPVNLSLYCCSANVIWLLLNISTVCYCCIESIWFQAL